MQVYKCLLGCLLGLAVANSSAQVKDYKDPYSASENGRHMAPSKALDVMLTQYETELLRAAEAMPADKYSFEPTAATFASGSLAKYGTVRTFAEQMTHLIGANYYFYSKVSGVATPAKAEQARTLKTKDEILLALRHSFTFAHAQVSTLTAQNAFNGIEGADGMHTPATLAAFAVAHGFDHYGQIVEYLRMNGIVPPGSN